LDDDEITPTRVAATAATTTRVARPTAMPIRGRPSASDTAEATALDRRRTVADKADTDDTTARDRERTVVDTADARALDRVRNVAVMSAIGGGPSSLGGAVTRSVAPSSASKRSVALSSALNTKAGCFAPSPVVAAVGSGSTAMGPSVVSEGEAATFGGTGGGLIADEEVNRGAGFSVSKIRTVS
jgi:hypothetical protein